jgi:hypothetical protein
MLSAAGDTVLLLARDLRGFGSGDVRAPRGDRIDATAKLPFGAFLCPAL